MSLFGKHTIDETEDLMKTVEFRIKAGDKVNNQITDAQIRSNLQKFTDIEDDWTKWKARWATARQDVLLKLSILNLQQPLVPVSLIQSEDEYQTIKKAINVGGQDTFTRGDLIDCLNRIEDFAGSRIDEKDAPMPSGFDPDLLMYQKLDKQIKEGEKNIAAAAAAASGAAKEVAFKVPWYVWLGGGVAVLAVGHAYVAPFLPHKPR